MRRVSSLVRLRAIPTGDSFPPISTRGGLPGEKKRSLILGEAFSIAANSAGVENGAGAGATPVAAPALAEGAPGWEAGAATFGATFVGEDITAVSSFK